MNRKLNIILNKDKSHLKEFILFVFAIFTLSNSLGAGINHLHKQFKYYEYRNGDSCSYYGNQIVVEDNCELNGRERAKLLYAQGDVYTNNSDFHKAHEKYNDAISLLKDDTLNILYGNILQGDAYANSLLWNTNESLKQYHKALNLFKALNNKKEQVHTLVWLGEFYRRNRKFEDGLKYLTDAENLCDHNILNSPTGFWLHNRLAANHSEKSRYPLAIKHSEKAIEISNRINVPALSAASFLELGYINHRLKNFQKTDEYYLRAYNLWKSLNLKRNMATALIKLAVRQREKNNYLKGHAYLDTLKNIFQDKEWLGVELEYYRERRRLYRKMGDELNVYKNWVEAYRVDKLMKHKQNLKEIERIKLQFEDKEKDWLLQKHKQELAFHKLETSRYKSERAYLLSIGGILFILSISLGVFYKTIHRKNKELSLVNAKLNEANSSLKLMVDEKHLLIKEIHHRVKNNLSMLSGLVQLQKTNIKDELAKDVLNDCQARIGVLSEVHKQMQESAHKPTVKTGDFFNHFLNNLAFVLSIEPDTIQSTIHNLNDEITLKQAIPLSLLINELITNSVKHGNPKNSELKIFFNLRITDKKIFILIADNGLGIRDEQQIHKPTSTGLKLVSIFTKQLNAELRYSKNELSQFNISFSLN